ncbi:MAG: OmpH family outer membrane protein [Hydrogenovibrio sp.]|uniref:OmpH family outer membrane protein n=1 Tax=Hydrogenovibrio sp. TaxID=2065821 RepID=UPI0028702744|nr:OmpH family outer membrane protein [Hydrogenovibrio sp.]MDR9497631.1 OmpH family outer membrane protein [Hydrogenovibrio sp.]
MSIHRLFLVGWLAWMLTATAWAQQPANIAVVNVGLLLEQAPQAQAAGANLEKEFEPQQAELENMAQQLEKKQQAFQKNQAVMTDAQKAASEREMTMLSRDIQRKRNDIQELVNIRRNEELSKIQETVNDAIKSIGKESSYDLILYEGIAYTSDRLDITQKVLEFLKESHQAKRSSFNQ